MKTLGFGNTDTILSEHRLFTPPNDVVEYANITTYMQSKGFDDYDAFYEWSLEHRTEFWDDQARELHWFQTWNTTEPECGSGGQGQAAAATSLSTPPQQRWFAGGKFNIVYNCLDRHMQTGRRTKVAYYYEADDGSKRTLTYEQLYKMTNQFAKGLQNLGVQKGDRVAIYMPIIPELPAAMLAVARLGAIHTVICGGFAADALRDRMINAEAKVLITADGSYRGGKYINLKKLADEATAEVPTIEKVVVMRYLDNAVPMQIDRDIYWDELVADIPEDILVPCEPMDSEDPLYILYTSGSTGEPKGVVHVQAGYAVGVYATTKFVFDVKENDVYWCATEVGWVTGHSYIVYGPLMNGMTSVLFEGTPVYPAPDRFWKIVEGFKVNILYTSPTAIRGLMRFGEGWSAKCDISSLRLLGSVGEPINPEAWIWYRQNIGRDELPIMDTWWQTETGMILLTPTIRLPLKPGSVSRPFPTVEAYVVDNDGQPVGPEKGGFLVIRHSWPAQMSGIYKDQASYEAYWNTIPGVYFAGDAATVDQDGNFRILGRVDDVIKVSGHRLCSMEIESSLVSHPAVAEAAAIGKPDLLKGERIKVFVILKRGFAPSEKLEKDLKMHVRTMVGALAVPDELDFASGLPKTRSGKIMRRIIRSLELGEPVGDISTLDM